MAGPHGAQEPSDRNIDNTDAITTGNLFTVASDRSIYAIRFWAPQTVSGTYAVGLWEVANDDDPGPAAGTLLASVTGIAAASIVADAWNRIELSAPVAVVTTKQYRAGRWASNGRFVRTSQALATDPIAANGITIPVSGGSSFDGVFRNGTFNVGVALAYPATAFDRSDYFVEPDDADDAPPAVDVAGAVTIGAVAASGAATVGLHLAGAVAVGEVVASGALLQRTPVSVLGAVTIGEMAASGTATAPVTERPPGFGSLLGMFRDARRNAGQRVPTPDCPYDGTILDSGRGARHCPHCGRVYA